MGALRFTVKFFVWPVFAMLACSAALFAIIEIAAKHMGELCIAGITWLGRGGK